MIVIENSLMGKYIEGHIMLDVDFYHEFRDR